jgi:hypothetical protein
MENQEMLDIYNNVSQEEHDEYEAMYELLIDHNIDIPNDELKRALSYFILKTYLLENKLI